MGEWANGRTGERAHRRMGENGASKLLRFVQSLQDNALRASNRPFAGAPFRRFAAPLLAPLLTVPSTEENPLAIGQF